MVHQTLPVLTSFVNVSLPLIIDCLSLSNEDERTSDNPSKNFGTCTNTSGSYFCTCAPGWTDLHCEDGRQVMTQ